MDDNMLFGNPSVQEALKLKSLLTEFWDATRASINKVKFQISLFHTPAITQSSIARILGFSIASLPSKYLGTLVTDTTLKHSSWKLILEKLEAHLSSWTYKALNMASCLVLIKAILQSMPLYHFSVQVAPKWILKEIKQLQITFLWGNMGQNWKWVLVKWDIVCLPKKSRGTMLHDPQHSNVVMGAWI